MDGGQAWWATVHGVAKSRTRLSDFTFSSFFSLHNPFRAPEGMQQGWSPWTLPFLPSSKERRRCRGHIPSVAHRRGRDSDVAGSKIQCLRVPRWALLCETGIPSQLTVGVQGGGGPPASIQPLSPSPVLRSHREAVRTHAPVSTFPRGGGRRGVHAGTYNLHPPPQGCGRSHPSPACLAPVPREFPSASPSCAVRARGAGTLSPSAAAHGKALGLFPA